MLENIKGAKKIEETSSIIRLIYRIPGLFFARVLFNTNITPNQISWISFFLNFPAAFFFFLADYKYIVIGAVILYIALVLDSIDGSLARLRNETTSYGAFLDNVLDMVGVVLILLAISFGVYNNKKTVLVWLFAFLALGSFFVRQLIYDFFTKSFSQAYGLFETEKRKRKFLKNFSYDLPFFHTVMLIGAFFNVFYLFLIFCALYGWFFNFIFFGMLLRKGARIDKK